jgi:subtilisin family serine protease
MFSFTATKSLVFRIGLVLGLVFATVLATTPAQAYIAVARGTYIVQVKDGTAATVRALIGKLGETPHDELTEVMDGFVLDLTDAEVAALRADANVIQVVADQPMSLMDSQSPAPSWGLDRIDQTNTTYDNTYNYPASAGAGVRVYIVDTGVMASDPDFSGRIETGADMLNQNLQGADCNGHGTHVAGTVAGTKFGVAKKATIVPIRVLGCTGSGSWSGFISAMDWIIANHPTGTPGVMNASLGGGKYQLVNDAVQKLFAAGITPVIAAGNSNADACAYSPSSTPNALTVGASDNLDNRAYFSNFGDCVDVFAPGVGIMSNNFADATTPRSLSGTSMAAPHVAGLAALYLGDNKAATPTAVTAAIQAGAQAGVVVDAKSAAGNYLINTKFTNAALPPVGAPTAVTASAITSSGATISWTAPAGTQAATGYKVEYREANTTAFTSVDSATTTVALTALKANTTYSVRVASVNGTTTSPASGELVFSTLGTLAEPPTNLRTTSIYGSQISLAWDAPTSANGSKITGYEVWMDTAGTWSKRLTTSTTVANINSLTAITTYAFRVLAVNALGVSAPSNTISVLTTAATPSAVVMTTRSNLTATTITVNWNTVAAIDSTTPITYRVVVTNLVSKAVTSTYVVQTPTIALTGLTRLTTYSIVVTAFSATIAGPPSTPYTFGTLADVPTSPTNVAAQKTSVTQFNIVWKAPRDNGGVAVTGYKVEQLVAGAWTLLATTAVTVNNYLVPAPAMGSVEQYRVSAVNSIGTSAAVNVNVVGTSLPPEAPTGLTYAPLAGSTTNGLLSWVAPTNNGGSAITGYDVKRSADGGTTWTTLVSSLTTTSFSTALPPKGATYTFTVVAKNPGGSSANAVAVSYSRSTSAPSAPSAPAASFTTDGMLTVTWRAPSDNGGSAITSFKLQRFVNAQWTTIREALDLQAKLTREASGTSYSLRVIAVNAIGESLPSVTTTISVPFAKSSAPRNLAADTTSQNNRVVLSWLAPENTGGTAVNYYRIECSSNSTSWLYLTTSTTLTASINPPNKGTTLSYRVFAMTVAGLSDVSNTVAVTIAAGNPNSPSTRSLSFAADGSIVFAWYAPADNGGSPITGYRVETSTNGTTYTELARTEANVLTLTTPRANPGVRVYFRVFAVSALGQSNASSVASIQVPFLKATAPLNFTAVDSGSRVAVSWAAPENLGGSATVSYRVQFSRDAGATWSTSLVTSATSGVTMRPTKGTTWQYRVFANTSFGYGDYSNVVSIAAPATVPSLPGWSKLAIATDGNIDARWYTPSDNGGSAITGYTIQKSLDQVNWSTVATPAFGINAIVIAKENPGVRVFFRMQATNAIGTSAFTSAVSIQMPFLKASAPQNFAVVDMQSYVRATWAAPTNLGGSTYLIYQIQYSRDGGATWLTMTSVSSTSANITRPAKGTTWQYRVAAYTSFGFGETSGLVSISAATTVASAPVIRSFTMNPDQSMNLVFNGPSDLGGVALTGYVVERSSNGSVWTTMSNLTTAGGPVVIEKQPAGTRVFVRVIALNSVGASSPSGVASLQTPFVQASAVQNLTSTPGTSMALRWVAPTDLGGSASVQYYQVQYSADGINWVNYLYTSGLSANLPNPPKGLTYSYRVLARTDFGFGLPSNLVSATTATTAPSSVTAVRVVRNSATLFTVNFNRPSDLGGIADWSYRVLASQGNSYVEVAAGTGSLSNSVQLTAPAANVYGYYRIIASNSKGDSVTYTFLVRG